MHLTSPILITSLRISFNHGDSNSNVESDSQPYVQLLSLTEQNDAWKEFHEARTKALNHLPPVIDPADFLKLTQTMSNSSSSVKLMTSGAVSQDDTSTAAGTTSLVGKYTPIVVGLLAGNLLVGVGIFFLGIFACTRSVIRGGAKTSVLGSSYTAVSLKSDD